MSRDCSGTTSVRVRYWMGRLAASYSHDRGTVCVEGISNRRSSGRRSDQLVLLGQKRAQLIRPQHKEQSPVVNPLSPLMFPLGLWALKLRGWQPPRQARGVCDRPRGPYGHANLLRHPRVAERGLILVAWLVIALLVVNVLLRLAPPVRTPDKIDARLDRQRRDAGASEREMIGPEERAADVGLRLHDQALRARRGLEQRTERRAVHAEGADVARRAANVRYIEVQDRGGLGERQQRPLHVRLAAEQATLLCRSRHEHDGPRRPGQLRQRLGCAEHGGDAGCGVVRTVADSAPMHGGADPLV